MAEQPKQFWDSEEERKKFEEAQKIAAKTPEGPRPAAVARDAAPAVPVQGAAPSDGVSAPGSGVVAAKAQTAPRAGIPVNVGETGALMPDTMDAQWRLACAMAQPGVLGPAYEGKPGAVLMAINLAMERGKGPFSFLHSSYEVKGKITEWGADALGAVYASGKAKSLDFFFMSKDGKRIDELDILTPAWAAVAVGERSDMPVRVIRYFTEDDARRANLLGNPKKETWTQYTRRMLETKAIGHMLKVAFPDVIAGLDMPEYQDHAPNDPGANTEARTPSSARERLIAGSRSEVHEAAEGEPVPGVRAEAGRRGARTDQEGDAEQQRSEPNPAVPGVSPEPAQVMVQVPRKAPRGKAGPRSKGLEDLHGSVHA